MSILDRIRNEEDEDGTDGGNTMENDDVLFDEGSDGGDELDELGGWDDESAFDGLDGGSENDESVAELEHTVGELETEMGQLSSTVNTVRSENQEISETVEGIEDNVRKLLDIYEMVTRGVNPFVDDVQPSGSFDSGAFGVFADGSTGTKESEDEPDLDDSIASADPESFFDDDLDDDQAEGEGVSATVEAPSGGTEAAAGEGDGGGKSFEEIKQEYEDGSAEWVDDDPADSVSDDLNEDEDEDERTTPSVFEDEGDGGRASETGQAGGTIVRETRAEPEREEHETSALDVDPSVAEFDEPVGEEEVDDGDADLSFAENTLMPGASRTEKPYLTGLPDGYVGDLIVMDWIEFLVEQSDLADAYRAIDYYESIEWIDGPTSDQLRAFLQGFGDEPEDDVDDGRSALTTEHHTQSLRYISQLASTTAEALILNNWTYLEGGRDVVY